jgi:hypothetical protein
MKTFEQHAELIRQEAEILRSSTLQEIKSINATAAAKAFQIKQKANAHVLNLTIAAEEKAFNGVQQVKKTFPQNKKYLKNFSFSLLDLVEKSSTNISILTP